MTTLDSKQRSAFRAALIKSGVSTRGLDDAQLQAQAAKLDGMEPAPAPFAPQPEPTTQEPEPMTAQPATPAQPDAGQLGADIAALIQASMKPQAPAMDESRIVELIKEHTEGHFNITVTTHTPRGTSTVASAHPALPRTLSLCKLYPVVNRAPYLVGPAGSGKTTLAMQAAESLELPFYSTGAVFDKFELLGFQNATGEYVKSALYKAFTTGGVFLFDEIDASAPEALTAFNQLIANGVYTFPDGELHHKHPDFYPIAAANTVGTGPSRQYASRVQLDGATLDRFTMIEITYDKALENKLAAEAAYAVDDQFDSNIVRQWVTNVRKVREWADQQSLPILITPRDSIAGAAMLADDWALNDVAEATIFSKLTADQIGQLKSAVTIR